VIANQNTGYAGGNNRGASQAQGEFLVFLNPDTVLEMGALEALLAPFAQSKDVALTTACIVHMNDPERINTCGAIMHYTGLTYCRGAGQPRSKYAAAVEVDAVSGAAFAIRRAVFEELGSFDECFGMYVEDTDLSWRAGLLGYRCLYVPDAVIKHDYRMSYSPTKAFYLERNRHLMLLKNLSRSTYLSLLPSLLLAELVTWGFLLLKGPRFWGVKIRVYRWLWEQRQAIAAAHRTTQALRRRSDHEIVDHLTYQLEFQQLAGARITQVAESIFHPAFRLVHALFVKRS
jgi:GT2 family glycosyltransferase